MAVVTVDRQLLCSGDQADLGRIVDALLNEESQQGGIDPDRRATQMAGFEQRYRLADELHAKLSPGLTVELIEGTKVLRSGPVGAHPDLLRMKALLAEEHDVDAPEGWIIFAATRPLVGHAYNEPNASLYLGGRFRVAVDPAGERAAWMIEQNRANDASVVVIATRAETVAMALQDNDYQDAYLSDFRGMELTKALSSQIQDLSESRYGDMVWALEKVRLDKDLLFAVSDNLEVDKGLSSSKLRSEPRFG